MGERLELQAASIAVLRALEAECDRGYGGPRYTTAHDVARRADRSVSTATKWLSHLAGQDLAISSARSGRKGGWKISDKGREALAAVWGQS